MTNADFIEGIAFDAAKAAAEAVPVHLQKRVQYLVETALLDDEGFWAQRSLTDTEESSFEVYGHYECDPLPESLRAA